MFFDLLKAVGTVVAVLSEVLKLETEAVPVSLVTLLRLRRIPGRLTAGFRPRL